MKQHTTNAAPNASTHSQAQTLPSVDPTPSRSFAPLHRRRVIQDTGETSATRQEFKDECDINRILAGFQRTGALNHFAKYSGSYGDFSACDLQTAQNLLIRARQMFDELPSAIRREVSTPEGFLDFVQDPANAERMAALGLTKPVPGLDPAPKPPAAPAPSEGA